MLYPLLSFQVCSELDVGLTTTDWLRLRRLLLGGGSGGDVTSAAGRGQLQQQQQQLVVLGDFLSELQVKRYKF
jgi:hypothetical protein